VPVFSEQADDWNEAVSRCYERGVAKIMDLHFARHREDVIQRSFSEVAKSHSGDEFTESAFYASNAIWGRSRSLETGFSQAAVQCASGRFAIIRLNRDAMIRVSVQLNGIEI
jgi:hypothetical protein